MLARIKLISRYKKYFGFKYRKIFCCSLILSLVDYCLPAWGFICNSKIDRLNGVIFKMKYWIILDKPSTSNEKWNILKNVTF